MELKIYADVAFGTKCELTSQLEYITIPCYSAGNMHILDYSSKKSKRAAGYILSRKINTFLDGFDRICVITKDLQKILGIQILIYCFTDSKQLFDYVTRGQ